MIHFIDSSPGRLPQKRKQCARACDTCRKRKKRCQHEGWIGPSPSPPLAMSTTPAPSGLDNAPAPSEGPAVHAEPQQQNAIAEVTPVSQPTDYDDRSEGCYVGETNPESTFLAASTSATSNSIVEPDSMGVWLSHRSKAYPGGQSHSSSVYTPDPLISQLFLPYLEQHCLTLLPAPPDLDGLTSIYLRDIHPIFPVLNKARFESMPAQDPGKALLSQAVCLAASATWGTNNFLRLSAQPDTVLSPKDFAEKITLAMLTTVNFGVVKDRLVLIQVLSLLSLFNQLSDDRHLSADLAGRAVTLVQTLGLHLGNASKRADGAYSTRLFSCVWALDRLNAAFHGRPTMIHERDLPPDIESCFQQQEPCFRLLLRILLLFDEVISLYRPTGSMAAARRFDESFPNFEELAYACGAHLADSQTIASIETLYHAVAILSCRSPSPSPDSTTTVAAHVRQVFSAGRVTDIVRDELDEHVSLLPIVPYAVSLSLRVFYRDIRLARAAIFRRRARRQLVGNCRILRQMGNIFSSAVVMAGLAEEAVREMDRLLPSDAAGERADTEQREAKDSPAQAAEAQGEQSGRDADGGGAGAAGETAPTSRSLSVDNRLLDSVFFDSMPDLDIFAPFDMDLDLDAFDVALENSAAP